MGKAPDAPSARHGDLPGDGRPLRLGVVGLGGRIAALSYAVAPGLIERFLPSGARPFFTANERPPGPGNLYEPTDEDTGVSAGWRDGGRQYRELVAALYQWATSC